MNKLAQLLNEKLEKFNPALYEMLSDYGKSLYFPKGILSQTAEAKAKATKYNATIGMALENNDIMALDFAMEFFNDLTKKEIFPYASVSGNPELIKLWKRKIYRDNPDLGSYEISNPIPVSGLTHGLSIFADLFVNKDDIIVLPDLYWGNYNLIFNVKKRAKIVKFPMFDFNNNFNVSAFRETLQSMKRDKIIVILNFPNNPTGFSPDKKTINTIKDIILEKSKESKIIVLTDDAYFGLYYSEEVYKQSPFTKFANLSENVLAVKVDGATKEQYVWGWRIAFISYAIKSGTEEIYNILLEKTKGAIRASISNPSHLAQSLLIKILKHPDYIKTIQAKKVIMEERAKLVMNLLANEKFKILWEPLPFNSGYFCCLKLKNINAEDLRNHLLNKYKVGIIAINDEVIRVAFSNVDKENILELFEIIYQGARDLAS